LNGLSKKASSVKQYTTNASSDLSEKELSSNNSSIQPKSVVTVVYDFK